MCNRRKNGALEGGSLCVTPLCPGQAEGRKKERAVPGCGVAPPVRPVDPVQKEEKQDLLRGQQEKKREKGAGIQSKELGQPLEEERGQRPGKEKASFDGPIDPRSRGKRFYPGPGEEKTTARPSLRRNRKRRGRGRRKKTVSTACRLQGAGEKNRSSSAAASCCYASNRGEDSVGGVSSTKGRHHTGTIDEGEQDKRRRETPLPDTVEDLLPPRLKGKKKEGSIEKKGGLPKGFAFAVREKAYSRKRR